MLYPAGSLWIPVGFIIFFFFILWFLYTIPLDLLFFAVRDNLHLKGNFIIRFGIISVTIQVKKPLEVIVCVSSKLIWTFPLSLSDNNEKSDETEQKTYVHSFLQLITWIPLLTEFIRRIISHFSINNMTCYATIGCGNPYTTGIIYGYIQAFLPLLNLKVNNISINPDFEKSVLEGKISMDIRIRSPVYLLIIAFRVFIPSIIHRNREVEMVS